MTASIECSRNSILCGFASSALLMAAGGGLQSAQAADAMALSKKVTFGDLHLNSEKAA